MIDAEHMKEWIWQRASNDGEAHSKKGETTLTVSVAADNAVQKAYTEYIKALTEAAREEFDESIHEELSGELMLRWMKT